MKRFFRIASLGLVVAVLGGCGFKGPLTLPEDAEGNAPAEVKDADATDVKKNPDTR